MMHLFHKWAKWRLEKVKIDYRDHVGRSVDQGEETYQRRECEICGLVQTRKVL